MADKLPEEVVSAVAIGNLKSISEQPAMLSNLAYSNTVANTNLSKCGPEGSHVAQRGQNGLKYPKMAFSRPNMAKSSRRGSTQHSKLGAAGTGTPRRGYSGSVLDFYPKVYIGFPPLP